MPLLARRFLLLASLVALSCSLSACSVDAGVGDCECEAVPAPICSADGSQRIQRLPPGTCEDTTCVYQEIATDCAFGCFDGECSTVPPECAPNPCTAPPAPSCDGNVLVQALVPGACSEGPTCQYTSTRRDCGDDLCFDGECRPRDCSFVRCDSPPDDRCDDEVAVAFPALGVCEPDSLECTYAEARTDCAERGQRCSAGTCVDLCDGVVCETPPASACDGATAVRYASVGTCSAGDCAYERADEDCSASGQACIDGVCVAACEDDGCVNPPAPTCTADSRTAIVFAAVGRCGDEDACVYEEARRVDCATDGLVCIDGACVDDPLCEGVACDEIPSPACEGDVAVTFGAGDCVGGACQFARTSVNCAAAGLLCSEGACVDACALDGCVSPPEPSCIGNAAVAYGTFGTCDPLEGCAYPMFVDNCGERGLICDAGVCVDPGCDCTEPPGPGLCDGNTRIEYVTPGFCDEGTCLFKEQPAEDCALTDTTCVLGSCAPDCPTAPCVPPAPSCDGSVALTYNAAGTCVGGDTCDFSAAVERTDCASEGLACVDGACVDACETLTCDLLPEATCEGDTLVVSSFPSACVASACQFRTTRIDCTATGDVCFDGACTDPCIGVICDSPPADECIDNVAVDYRPNGRCEEGVCSYGSDDFNCSLIGFVCEDAECLDACAGVVCDDVPADGCVGEVATVYSGEGVCTEGDCIYLADSAVDCAEFGRACELGLCIDPCAGVVCETPPAASCSEDVAVRPLPTGSCEAGDCQYAFTQADCSALGAACRAGQCVDDCTAVVCPEREGTVCEGGIAVEFSASEPTCLAGACFYDRTEQDCVAEGLGCVDGRCEPVADLCAFIDCAAPAPACVDGQRVSYLADGTCDPAARGCDVSAVEVVEDCNPGQRCVNGDCRQAPTPGDIIIHEVFFDAVGSDETGGEWVELLNVSGRVIDLGGSELIAPTGARYRFPDTTLVADGDVIVIGSEGARAVVDLELGFLAFNLPNAGGELRLESEGALIDAIAFDASWGLTPDVALTLRATARSASANDSAAAWCASASAYSARGQRGTPQEIDPNCAD